MGVQTRADINVVPFIRYGESIVLEAETLVQDAGRAKALAKYTLMTQVPATGKWTPWIDETLANGQEFPLGIILASVTQAQLVAGDVLNIPILTGQAIFDSGQLVFDAVKTLATVISTLNLRVDRWLATLNLYPETTVDIASFENV